jgi:hypothetical protein
MERLEPSPPFRLVFRTRRLIWKSLDEEAIEAQVLTKDKLLKRIAASKKTGRASRIAADSRSGSGFSAKAGRTARPALSDLYQVAVAPNTD